MNLQVEKVWGIFWKISNKVKTESQVYSEFCMFLFLYSATRGSIFSLFMKVYVSREIAA